MTLEVFTTPWQQLQQWVRDGVVTNVKTMVGVMWLEKVLAGDWLRRISAKRLQAEGQRRAKAASH